jgi:hypothetical protein
VSISFFSSLLSSNSRLSALDNWIWRLSLSSVSWNGNGKFQPLASNRLSSNGIFLNQKPQTHIIIFSLSHVREHQLRSKWAVSWFPDATKISLF